MKKIYLTIIAGAFVMSASAQLSLTQAFNEPVIGNVQTLQNFDSVVVIPKNTGTNQMWNFSAAIADTIIETATFISVSSSGPNASIYTGATMADFDGGSYYNYYKSTSNMYENLGFEDANVIVQFTNTAVAATYPITLGYNFSDVAAGTCTAIVLGNAPGTIDGTSNVMGTGTGTLMLPGGVIFTNVLQTISTATININIPTTFIGPVTINNEGITYSYYHASQKFPVLTVEYVTTTGTFPAQTATVKMNPSVVTGVNDVNFDASFSIFPNPAKDRFTVKLQNLANANCNIEIVNSYGQIAQSINLGNETTISNTVSISELNPGIYMVKTTLGNKVSVRKLIVE